MVRTTAVFSLIFWRRVTPHKRRQVHRCPHCRHIVCHTLHVVILQRILPFIHANLPSQRRQRCPRQFPTRALRQVHRHSLPPTLPFVSELKHPTPYPSASKTLPLYHPLMCIAPRHRTGVLADPVGSSTHATPSNPIPSMPGTPRTVGALTTTDPAPAGLPVPDGEAPTPRSGSEAQWVAARDAAHGLGLGLEEEVKPLYNILYMYIYILCSMQPESSRHPHPGGQIAPTAGTSL